MPYRHRNVYFSKSKRKTVPQRAHKRFIGKSYHKDENFKILVKPEIIYLDTAIYITKNIYQTALQFGIFFRHKQSCSVRKNVGKL